MDTETSFTKHNKQHQFTSARLSATDNMYTLPQLNTIKNDSHIDNMMSYRM